MVSEEDRLSSIHALSKHLSQAVEERGGVCSICLPIGVVVGEAYSLFIHSYGESGGGTHSIGKYDDSWPSLRGRHLNELGGGVAPQSRESS